MYEKPPHDVLELYRYDPEDLWVYIQHGGNGEEYYLHACDHLDIAKKAIKNPEEASYHCEEPEPIPRSPLEQVAPVLLDLCRRLLAWVPPTEVDADLRRAVEHAGTTRHIGDIIAATRKWWGKRCEAKR